MFRNRGPVREWMLPRVTGKTMVRINKASMNKINANTVQILCHQQNLGPGKQCTEILDSVSLSSVRYMQEALQRFE